MKKKILLQLAAPFCLLFGITNVFSQTINKNETGQHDGFYYSFWTDGSSGTASITLKPEGRYQAKWNNIGNLTGGKGWSRGKEDRIICYSGKFNGGSNGYLALYGWTKDSLIEYYVVENYGDWIPPGAVSLGNFESDGSTYNVYKTRRINQPSIVGTATFSQFWSVRTTKRTNGIITFKNHVSAWKNKGMLLGKTWDYQIMETEGYKSSGYSDITVSECLHPGG